MGTSTADVEREGGGAGGVAPPATQSFPKAGILPKIETQALQFIQQSECDGQGVVVAILDTGVDPGASGLKFTSDGRPKVIDIVDCTGSGDVDMSCERSAAAATKVEEKEKGGPCTVIEGLSGRKLKLSGSLVNPTNVWRVGVKRGYELYPKKLEGRVKEERKTKWAESQRAAVAAVRREMLDWKEAHPSPSPADNKAFQDLEEKLASLKSWDGADKEDPGPIFDVVAYNDGVDWQVLVGSQQDWKNDVCDLTAQTPLRDFDKDQAYGTLTELDSLNYGVHVYDEGKVVSLVVDAGAHGTHVAGIVAAYHPDEPECNGVAPGAQIVSLKIGDSRLGSMETGPGLLRALNEAVRHRVDLINMSYGEATSLSNVGAFVDAANDVVNKHGILFLASAGNNGPALSTVGCPGGTTSSIMGIGAFVSPSMMESSHSMREIMEGCNYTWSSAGPTVDGDWGVSVMAPGGAIAPVPNWTLQRTQLMNGTSMSSPNCCGCVALIVSAAKAGSLPYTPHSIRRAVEASAAQLVGVSPLVQGKGIIQVQDAFDHLKRDTEHAGVRFNVTVGVGASKMRGFVLRQYSETCRETQRTVGVDPIFHENAPNDEKFSFEMKVAIRCEATWVSAPKSLVLMHNGRTFAVKVDPTGLAEGVHVTSLECFDAENITAGPVFDVPIVVIKPCAPQTNLSMDPVVLGPGRLVRSFVTPPFGSQWLDVTVRDLRAESSDDAHKDEDATRRVLVLHAIQLLPHTPYREVQKHTYLPTYPGQTEVQSIRVEGEGPIEIALAQFWNSLGNTTCSVELSFRGVSPLASPIVLHGGCGYAKSIVRSCIRIEDVAPTAKLDKWLQSIAPQTVAQILPLGSRDIRWGERQVYELLLSYKFTQDQPGDVTARLAPLNDFLYESPFEAQMCMIFDSNKRLCGVSDAWPSAIKCGKGEHTARVCVRGLDPDTLKRLQGCPLLLERSLKGKEVTITAHSGAHECLTGGKAFDSITLQVGSSAAILWAEPPREKLPDSVKPGDILLGSATYCKGAAALPGAGRRPGGYPVKYYVGPAPPKKQDEDKSGGGGDKNNSGSNPTDEEMVSNAVRDVYVSKLSSLLGKASFEAVYVKAVEQYPTHLPLLLLKASHLEAGEDTPEQLPGILDASDKVLAQIDTHALATHFGTNLVNPDDAESAKLRSDMEAKRSALRDALLSKGKALAKLPDRSEDFLAVYNLLQAWADVSEIKYGQLALHYYQLEGRKGSILKLLGTMLDDPQAKPGGIAKDELFNKRAALFEELGWSHVSAYERDTKVIKCPPNFPLI